MWDRHLNINGLTPIPEVLIILLEYQIILAEVLIFFLQGVVLLDDRLWSCTLLEGLDDEF